MRDGAVVDPLERRRALDRVKGALFGHAAAASPVMLGRYRLESRLAAGGVGVVYVAHDPRLDRRVAIKLLQPGAAAGTQGRQRLLREAQALARFDHPNIVKVFDVGTCDAFVALGVAEATPGDDAEATPGDDAEAIYVVMELVDGEQLGVWARGDRPWPAIVDAFMDAGRGLVAAHDHGIVHRDFKPANAIVSADGRVRVLDFGLAVAPSDRSAARPHATSAALSALATPLTRTGGVMGTPAYMAPEQHDGETADPRSDQFAFSVALWEALLGSRPHDGQTLEQLAQAKRAGPRRVGPGRFPELPVAVVRVLERGMAPEPDERYPDLALMLAALARTTAPAAAPRRWLGVAVVVSLAAGVGVLATARWLGPATPSEPSSCVDAERQLEGVWDDATRAEAAANAEATHVAYAPRAWSRTDRLLDARVEQWRSFKTEQCSDWAREAIDGVELARRLECADRQLDRVAAVVDVVKRRDPELLRRTERLVADFPSLAACVEGNAAAHVDDAKRRKLDVDLIRAQAWVEAGTYAEAETLAREVSEQAEAIAAHELAARARLLQARALDRAGDRIGAASAFRSAVLEAERADADDLAVEALLAHASVLADRGAFDRADEAVTTARAKLEAGGRVDVDLQVARTQGGIAEARGQYADAVAAYERALAAARPSRADDDPQLADLHNAIGANLEALGDTARARDHLHEALRRFERDLGPHHPDVAMVLNNLANVAFADGEYGIALRHAERALRIWTETLGESHPRVAAALNNLANVHQARGDLERALALHRRAKATAIAIAGPEDLQVAVSWINIATIERDQHDVDPCIEHAREARRVLGLSVGSDHPYQGFPDAIEGACELREGRPDRAAPLLEASLTRWEAQFGEFDERLSDPLVGLAELAVLRGKRQVASERLARARALTQAGTPERARVDAAARRLGLPVPGP